MKKIITLLLVLFALCACAGGNGSGGSEGSETNPINPHGYVIEPLEAAQLPLALADVDASVINGNYALGAGLPATHPALLVESFDAETTIRRTNFIVVLEGNEHSEKIQALVNAITSDAVQKYIEDTYKGAVITSFVDPQ